MKKSSFDLLKWRWLDGRSYCCLWAISMGVFLIILIFYKSLSQKYSIWDFSQAASLLALPCRISAAQQCHLWWSATKGLQMVFAFPLELELLVLMCLKNHDLAGGWHTYIWPVWGQKLWSQPVFPCLV